MDDNTMSLITFRNSRIFIGLTLLGSISAGFMSLCMLLMTGMMLFPLHNFTFHRVEGVIGWGFSTWCFGLMCPALWKLAFKMSYAEAKLDSRGVDFRLGTKKSPQELFLAWDQVASIQHKRVGNNQCYSIQGKDDSYVKYTSYTFFRPKKLARLIATRANQPIQEG
jgi:hypothetical protein